MATPENNTVLEVRNVTKVFPGVKALKGANLSFRRGEVHAIVGENGAGKSTLMKILSGVYPPTEGTIVLNGQEERFGSTYEAQLKGISIIFQEFSLIPNFTVTENIFLNREPSTKSGFLRRGKAKRQAQKLLDEIGFDLALDSKVGDLSVVQQQVVEILKALSVTAQVLIMDEPSATLTDVELQKLFEIIRTLKQKGVTIAYISHRLEEIFEIGDRVTVLKDGEVIGTRNIKNISKEELIAMMVGRQIDDIFPEFGKVTQTPLLEVRNLNKRKALFDINFSLYKGEILGFSGIVGAGRSLLAQCLFGMVSIDSGEILIHGKKQTIRSVNDAIDSGIGYIHEDRKTAGIIQYNSVKNNMTIANVKNYASYGFLDKRQELGDTKAYISRLTIKTSGVHQWIEEMSGGNQQKALISRWLLKNPELIIFDEPTRGIDVGAKVEIYKLMRMLASEGKAIMMISSELPEIIGLSDRILVMRQGRIAGIIDQHEKLATEEEIMSIAVGHTYHV